MVYTGDALTPLAALKGMSSWIKNNVTGSVLTTDNTCQLIGVHSVFDRLNNRMLFTFLDDSFQDTVSYSEYGGGFESLYDFKPHMYADMNGILLSVNPANRKNIYVHGIGDEGSFYGDVSDTTISILSNPEPELNKVYTNCEFGLNCTSGGNDIDATFYKYQAWNQYQDTGEVAFTIDDNIKLYSYISQGLYRGIPVNKSYLFLTIILSISR